MKKLFEWSIILILFLGCGGRKEKEGDEDAGSKKPDVISSHDGARGQDPLNIPWLQENLKMGRKVRDAYCDFILRCSSSIPSPPYSNKQECQKEFDDLSSYTKAKLTSDEIQGLEECIKAFAELDCKLASSEEQFNKIKERYPRCVQVMEKNLLDFK